jgi:hypothetical protein
MDLRIVISLTGLNVDPIRWAIDSHSQLPRRYVGEAREWRKRRGKEKGRAGGKGL